MAISSRKLNANSGVNGKSALLVSSRFPVPEFGGDAIRIMTLARVLKDLGYVIDLFVVGYSCPNPKQIREAKLIFRNIEVHRMSLTDSLRTVVSLLLRYGVLPVQFLMYCSRNAFKRYDRLMGNGYDVQVNHLVRTSYYVPADQSNDLLTWLEATDNIALGYERALQVLKYWDLLRVVYWFEGYGLRRLAKIAERRFSRISYVSKRDLSSHDPQSQMGKIVYLPLICLPRTLKEHSGVQRDIAFIGNMRTKPNRDAVSWFIVSVWPILCRNPVKPQFVVIGSMPRDYQDYLASQGINFVANPKDLRGGLDRVLFTVAPIRFGAGTQTKILDSFSFGLPVVMSRLAYEGLERDPLIESHLVVDSECPKAFILRCERILNGDRSVSPEYLKVYVKGYYSAQRTKMKIMQEVFAG